MFRKFLIILVLSFFVFPSATYAQQKDTATRVNAEQTINNDFTAANSRIVIDGTINGDAYLFGGDIEINGKVNGDLIAAGGTITVKGEVTQDVRLAGGNVTVSGKVGRNLTVGGGNVKLEGTDPLQGSALIGSGNFDLRKPITKNLTLGGGNVYLDAPIEGTSHVRAGEVQVGSKFNLKGDLNYTSEKQISLPQGASVSGKINYTELPKPQEPQKFLGNLTRGQFYMSLYYYSVVFFVGWLIWTLLPIFSQKVITNISQNWLVSTLIGLLALAILPMLVILLLISIMGIPLALVLVLAVFIYGFLANVYAASFVGHRILSNFGYDASTPNALLTGVLALFVISLVPILGGLVALAVFVVGSGALLKTKIDYLRELRSQKVV